MLAREAKEDTIRLKAIIKSICLAAGELHLSFFTIVALCNLGHPTAISYYCNTSVIQCTNFNASQYKHRTAWFIIADCERNKNGNMCTGRMALYYSLVPRQEGNDLRANSSLTVSGLVSPYYE